jgi:uncharacterized protein
MKITRIHNLNKIFKPNKVLIIYGARRVGKTTIVKEFIKNNPQLKSRLDSGDDIRIQHLLSNPNLKKLKEYAEGYDLIAIDEAQNIANVGATLKLMIDHLPKLKIIATGSSSFELSGQVGEPLTGRKITLNLYPISELELKKIYNKQESKELLEDRLIYGSYPEIITAKSKKQKIQLLQELTNSYLFKDILALENIKNSKKLVDLLRLIAFQIGNEVSQTELGKQLALDQKTVSRYLDLLEKSFILYNLRGFSKNLRKEIVKKSKYYFYDIGVRNAVISNFNELELRNDVGQLWENFIVIERAKKRHYKNIAANDFFWRTWDQQEIDLVEEREGKIFGYEIKWSKRSSSIASRNKWLESYEEAQYKIINPENYLNFIA